MKKTILTAAVIAAYAPAVFAGVLYEIETKDHTVAPPKSEIQQVKVQEGKIKVEMNQAQGTGAVVFRTGENANMTMIDDHNKKYVVMDKAQVEAIAGQVNQAMAQMQEALKNVPEAQRAMVEGMMKEKMDAFKKEAEKGPKKEIRKTGTEDTVNGYACATYEMWHEGKKESEFCLASWSKVKGGKEVEVVFGDMVSFFETLMESFSEVMPGGMGAGMMSESWTYMRELDGFPVRVREFSASGTLKSESVLRAATEKTFAKSEFEPGPEFTRQQMPMGPGAGF